MSNRISWCFENLVILLGRNWVIGFQTITALESFKCLQFGHELCIQKTCAVFVCQGRSPTCVTYVGKHSARAPTSSPTAVNTGTSGPTAVLAAFTASSTKWTCGSTRSTTAPTTSGQKATDCVVMMKSNFTSKASFHFTFNCLLRHRGKKYSLLFLCRIPAQ